MITHTQTHTEQPLRVPQSAIRVASVDIIIAHIVNQPHQLSHHRLHSVFSVIFHCVQDFYDESKIASSAVAHHSDHKASTWVRKNCDPLKVSCIHNLNVWWLMHLRRPRFWILNFSFTPACLINNIIWKIVEWVKGLKSWQIHKLFRVDRFSILSMNSYINLFRSVRESISIADDDLHSFRKNDWEDYSCRHRIKLHEVWKKELWILQSL